MASTSTSIRSELGFLGFTVLVAALFGIAHDLVTAHVAVEYFTEHHVEVVPSQSPVVMALIWGVRATFVVGMLGAVLLLGANGLGRWPTLDFGRLRRALVRLVLVLYVLAMGVLFGILQFAPRPPLEDQDPGYEADRRLIAVAFTHEFSYTGAAIGFVGLATWIVYQRNRMKWAQKNPVP